MAQNCREKIAENQEYKSPKIFSFQSLETKETPKLKTFFFSWENTNGITMPVSIDAYTKKAALEKFKEDALYKHVTESPNCKWWLAEVVEYNRSYIA